MRKVMILVSAITIASVVAISGLLTGANQSTEAVSAPRASVVAGPVQSQDPPGTIDGSVTPQLIPDEVAYELFFEFFSKRSADERGKLQAYCNQSALAGVDLDSIFATAAYYQQRVAAINAKAQAIRDSNQSLTMENAMQVNAQLAPFVVEKETVVQEVIAKIPDFVGAAGALAIRQHIDGRIKPHTKIVPGPNMPMDNRIMP